MFRRKPAAQTLRDAPVITAPPPVAPGSSDHISGIELVPVPCCVAVVREGVVRLDVVNRAFRLAGLGTSGGKSVFADDNAARIAAFIASSDLRDEFDWEVGEAVDSRHYGVTLARRHNRAGSGRCFITLIDNTIRYRTEQSLRREMSTDALTGLPNRAGFEELLESLPDGALGHHAVIAVDLARFSRINACIGSLAGDELLISVARRLKGALRGRDSLARTGGDEFGILLSVEDGAGDAFQVAKRIQSALSTQFRLSEHEVQVDCSIGIALGADSADSAEDLIRHAQFAVKRSQTTGRVEVYQSRSFDHAREQFSIEAELRRALDNGDLYLAFQPICDLATGRVTSFESLARWRTAQGIEMSPVDFIPVAEESGLIVPLGRWAMEECVRTLAEWDAKAGGDCGTRMAVNLSAIQLQRDQVANMVRGVLEKYDVSGSRLTLELTESVIVGDPDRVSQTVLALRDLGTTLAMDDFGTGYSNLAYLQKLPIDLLKIDRSFIAGMLADRDKIAIVRAILSLAQALGMQTTAEGIEQNELAQTLAAMGCTYGQGYLFSRPIEADAAYEFLVARNH